MAESCADQHEGRVAIRECPHHTSPAADLPVQPFNHIIEKVWIYRDYQFEVDLKPTVKEFKALWSKRSAQSANGAA